ncbi:hypothetical protein [Ferrimonas balearica]|uniref:hypothetical protein n=1 Tax=Ferrimonas balearica TaxID=44012 RepID=UPI001C999CE4|nr:hypothetical protein [Ferrimonas balearica]MBY5990713.1 hypothetical protein [Ferrimonas balearica]
MLFWRVMIALVAALMGSQLLIWLFTGGLSMLQWMFVWCGAFLLLPAFGFAYHYPIVPRWFAIGCATVLFVTFQFTLVMGIILWLQRPNPQALIYLTVHFGVVLVLLYPVWQYAFADERLWALPRGHTRMPF